MTASTETENIMRTQGRVRELEIRHNHLKDQVDELRPVVGILQTDVSEMRADIREIRTDLRWMKWLLTGVIPVILVQLIMIAIMMLQVLTAP